MEDVDLGLKRRVTLLLAILDKVLMMMGEVEISLRPATLPPITQVTVVDFGVYLLLLFPFTILLLVMKEVIVVVMM